MKNLSGFENFLISIGYIPYVQSEPSKKVNGEFVKSQLVEYNNHTISTLGIMGKIYIHKDFSDKVNKDDDIPKIAFGLHEKHKPETLIYPRPHIFLKRKGITEREWYGDDPMNHVLINVEHQKIYDAMFDSELELHFDLDKYEI